MNSEIFLKNGIFLSLFLSTVSFWTQNLQVVNGETNERPSFFTGIAYNLFQISFFLITSELLFRWYFSGHPPLSNLYESFLFLLWGMIGFFLFLLEKDTYVSDSDVSKISFSKFSLRNFLGSLLSSASLFLLTFADWRLPSEMREMKPLIPALQSNWLLMHVSIMILSYAALLIGCILAIAFVVLTEQSSTTKWPFTQKVLTDLDSLSYRILAFAFPLLTLGILSGAVWANEAWGSYWSWDPKETWAFITWLIFAFYLHTRLQYGWEGKKSALVATFGFFIVWICYLGVNLLGKGLHSYGWFS